MVIILLSSIIISYPDVSLLHEYANMMSRGKIQSHVPGVSFVMRRQSISI